MGLKEKTDQVIELMRLTKDDWVQRSPESTDLGIYLHFWRGDEVVVTVQCPLNRDTALHAGQLGAMGFNATTMAITFESYHSTLEKSPLTGEPWVHQEMQYVSETHPEAAEKEWVWPCLTTSIHDRDGEYALSTVPYLIQDGKITWLEEKAMYVSSAVEGEGGGGVMFEYLQQAMAAPTMEEQLVEAAKDDVIGKLMSNLVTDPEARMFHSDMATFRTLEERELIAGVIFAAEPGSNREKWLAERFGPPDPQ